MMTDATVRRLLRQACDNAGGTAAWARTHGFDRELADAVLAGRRPPARTILAALGLRRVVRYERAEGKHG